MRTKKRFLSMLLTICLIASMLPQTAFATEGATIGTSGLCEHHTTHDDTCGYVEGAAETPCAHDHTEDCYETTESCTHTHTADCYPVMDSGVSGNEATPSDAAEPIACVHECSEESGCITKELNCTHTEHDSECGYVEAVEGHDCHYECADCAAPVCTCETDDPAIHATNCPAYVAPENPVCYCAEKCTEDNVNIWCDVCGVQGIESCKAEDTAATYAFTSLTVGGTSVTGTTFGTNWEYNADSSTLTINGNIGSDSGSLAVNAVTEANSQDVLTIKVTDDAAITGGIYAGGKLHLEVATNKTLTVNSSGSVHAIESGYKGVEDSIKITGGGTVAALGSGNADGIKSGGGLWIEGVTVAAQGYNYGLDSGSGRLFINDNSKVYAVSSQNTAIVAPSTGSHDVVEITGENTVVVAGFALGDASNNYVPTTRTSINNSIHAGTVTVNCGHLIIGGGFSATTFNTSSMTNVSDASKNYGEYIRHLTYQQNTGGTHTPKCIDGCPVSYTGTAEDCSGTTYCDKIECSKCGQEFGEGDGASHTGGTATCKTQAVCTRCKTSYGSLNSSNHEQKATGYTYIDNTYHSAAYDCCGKSDGVKEEHTPSADNDLYCDKCKNMIIARALAIIADAQNGDELTFTGILGTDLYPVEETIKMNIPEGVIVNWDVKITGEKSFALLELSGEGTLNLTGVVKNSNTSNGYAIVLAEDSDVTLMVDEGAEVSSSSYSAIQANGGKEIQIKGGTVSGFNGINLGSTANVAVTVGGGTVTGQYYAIDTTQSTAYSKTITVSGGTVTGNSKGIYTEGKVVVSGSPTISGKSGTGDEAIYAGSLEISGSPTIEHATGDGINMYDSGAVVFKAGSSATVSGGNYGIVGRVTVEQGAKATVSGGISYGNEGTITVDGELTVSSMSGAAVDAEKATITVGTSGELTATSTDGYGISCTSLVVNGTVDATGENTMYYGVYTTTLTIDGGSVTASGQYAAGGNTISVTNGVIRADGAWIGISFNSMNVSGNSHIIGTVDGEDVFSGVSCNTIEINSDYYWCSGTEKPADLHGYAQSGLRGSASGETYFELITKTHLEAGEIKANDSITCACADKQVFSIASCTGGTATCAKGAVCTVETASGVTCGITYTNPDTSEHAWGGYAATGNVITATCQNSDCGNTATVTLNKPERTTYGGTGSASATTTVDPAGALTAPTEIRYTGKTNGGVSYDDTTAPTNAGSYTASITMGGVEAKVDYPINKADASVATVPKAVENLEYSNAELALINAGEATGGEMQYSLDGTNYSTNIPTGTAAGDYTVYYKVEGDSNHNDTAAQTITAKISKATASLDVPGEQTIAYGQHLSSISLPDGWKWVDENTIPGSSTGYAAYLEVDDTNYNYEDVDGYDSTTHRVTRKIQVVVGTTTPAITVQATPATAIAGKTITVSATVKNPHNESLSDLPTPTYTYKIGESGTETGFTGSFVIPENTGTGTTILITATTAANDKYAAGTGTATVIVTDCTHTGNKTLQYDTASHWYSCDDCDAELDKAAHSGGTATCTETAKCATCNQPHGDVDSTNHTGSTAWEYDATHHWGKCACGAELDKETHSGGTATCKDKATCTDCGQTYGDLNSSNHTGGTEVRDKAEATTTAEGYTGDTYCLGCTKKIATGTTIPKKDSGGTGGNTGGGDSGNDNSGSDTPTVPDDGDDTPSDTPATPVTVPVSGEQNSIQVDAAVSGTTATIDHVDLSALNTVIGDDVKTGVVKIDFSVLDVEVDTVEIPADAVKQIAAAVNDPDNDAESLEIVLTDGTSIEFDAVALGEKSAQAGGQDITISIKHTTDSELSSSQQQTVGSRPAFDINVTSGGQHISDMGGKITVHAPYELRSGEKASGIVVYYVDDHGNKERCETSYDSAKKRVNWKTDHLSVYMIAYEESTGSDTTDTTATTLDTCFRTLRLEVIKTGRNFLKLQWAELTEADGYVIYGAPCNTGSTTHKIQKLKVIKDGDTTSWTHRGLEDGTFYKYYVKAYKLVDGRKVFLAKSRAVHAVTTGGKYANASYVDVNEIDVTLKVGERFTIEATEVAKKKKLKQHTVVRFESGDPAVAAVGAKNGTITAKAAGTCIIWVYAQNGEWTTVNVTVK